ncbi:MAG TPA: alpha/beta fold hydrolase [Candidatus Limnocylindrales bacterium]|nr:alpha/beta fold hydrolase [Candidatus Limnocylindrales bacterium]
MTATRHAPPEVPPATPARPREQSRARYPHRTGVVERAGGRVAYEIYGAGDPPIVFVPPWQIVHSRVWKAQIPMFARRHLVVAWDNRGNGRSDRPTDPALHTTLERAANLGAVMDAAGVPAAVLVGLSSASGPLVVFAARNPERVLGLVFVGPAAPFGEPGRMAKVRFEERLPTDERWAKENIHYWRRDYRGYLEFFFGEAFPEPHSTKQIDDGVGWGLDTDPDSLAATHRTPRTVDPESFGAMCASIGAPTLVIQGTDERLSHVSQGIGLARAIPGARLELIEGGGHMVNVRLPVRVNLRIRDFIRSLEPPR